VDHVKRSTSTDSSPSVADIGIQVIPVQRVQEHPNLPCLDEAHQINISRHAGHTPNSSSSGTDDQVLNLSFFQGANHPFEGSGEIDQG
jgi:hypothetical protein